MVGRGGASETSVGVGGTSQWECPHPTVASLRPPSPLLASLAGEG